MIVVIVAHPDDEALWCGGLLLRLADAAVPLTILCVTNRSNAVRSQEFRAACEMLNAQARMLDCPDGGNAGLPDFSFELDELSKELVQSGSNIDLVLTHAPHGNERNHPQHRECYRIVRMWAKTMALPFGVFSEAYLEGTVQTRTLVSEPTFKATYVRRSFRNGVVTAMRALYRLRYGWQAAVSFWNSVKERGFLDSYATITVAVDLDRKRSLCERHPSQMQGIEQYATLTNSVEHVFLGNSVGTQNLAAALRGR